MAETIINLRITIPGRWDRFKARFIIPKGEGQRISGQSGILVSPETVEKLKNARVRFRERDHRGNPLPE